jgi:uncharacterized protein (DUF305 family)
MEGLILKNANSPNKITRDYLKSMEKTMVDMMVVSPTASSGNLDVDFAAYMIPHHQAAVDMAKVILAMSVDPELADFCRQIILDQEKEIDIMKEFIKNKE